MDHGGFRFAQRHPTQSTHLTRAAPGFPLNPTLRKSTHLTRSAGVPVANVGLMKRPGPVVIYSRAERVTVLLVGFPSTARSIIAFRVAVEVDIMAATFHFLVQT